MMNNTTPPIFVKVKPTPKVKKKRARGFSYWEISTFEIRRTGICWLLPTLVVAWIFEKVVRVWERLTGSIDRWSFRAIWQRCLCIGGSIFRAHTLHCAVRLCVCVYNMAARTRFWQIHILFSPPTANESKSTAGHRFKVRTWSVIVLSYRIFASRLDRPSHVHLLPTRPPK